MGAITPLAAGLTTLVGAVNTASQVFDSIGTLSGSDAQEQADELALEQLRAQQSMQEQQLAQQNALQKEQLALQASQDEEDRRDALRRAVARQRAAFGASGVGSGGGSSQAVLLGLANESDEERTQREALDNLRSTALDQDLAQTQSLNLLQATQLQEKQELNNLF